MRRAGLGEAGRSEAGWGLSSAYAVQKRCTCSAEAVPVQCMRRTMPVASPATVTLRIAPLSRSALLPPFLAAEGGGARAARLLA